MIFARTLSQTHTVSAWLFCVTKVGECESSYPHVNFRCTSYLVSFHRITTSLFIASAVILSSELQPTLVNWKQKQMCNGLTKFDSSELYLYSVWKTWTLTCNEWGLISSQISDSPRPSGQQYLQNSSKKNDIGFPTTMKRRRKRGGCVKENWREQVFRSDITFLPFQLTDN